MSGNPKRERPVCKQGMFDDWSPCGELVKERSGVKPIVESSWCWDEVTCKNCLRTKGRR